MNRNLDSEAARVLQQLSKLSENAIRMAIDGIAQWLSAWGEQISALPETIPVWLHIWPIAVETTNAKQTLGESVSLDTQAKLPTDQEPWDLDTLNTPTGKLISTFIAVCHSCEQNSHALDCDSAPRRLRDTIITATGRSRLISLYRMIEILGYFFKSDREWAERNLLPPLLSPNPQAATLWRAVARKPRFGDVLRVIGDQMVERTLDQQLGREARHSLVFNLVAECLNAIYQKRAPAIPYERAQQMIRSLNDEARACAADVVGRFVRDAFSHQRGSDALSASEIFRASVVPFFQTVWPQERSLGTPGLSQALADLPAKAEEAFVDAVNTIERFLVPFDCWSLLDYGLFGEEDGKPKLAMIDNPDKACAFLRLLDLTIGAFETAVFPRDLPDALDQIRKVAPDLASHRVFLRLATLARRG